VSDLICSTVIKIQKRLTFTHVVYSQDDATTVDAYVSSYVHQYINTVRDDLRMILGGNIDTLVTYYIDSDIVDVHVDNTDMNGGTILILNVQCTVKSSISLKLNVAREVKTLNQLKLKHPTIATLWKCITSEDMGWYVDIKHPFANYGSLSNILDL